MYITKSLLSYNTSFVEFKKKYWKAKETERETRKQNYYLNLLWINDYITFKLQILYIILIVLSKIVIKLIY